MTHHQVGPAPGTGRTDGEVGFSLVEVLVAVAILGIAFAALLGAMATSIQTSDLHRQQAETQAVLASAVERVKSPETPRVACATPATYLAAAQAAAAGATRADGVTTWPATSVQVTRVRYADGDDDDGFGATCYDDDAHAVTEVPKGIKRRLLTLQEVTIRVSHPDGDGRQDRSLTFVKGVG